MAGNEHTNKLAEAINELVNACNSFGASIEESAGIIKTLGKVNLSIIKFKKEHPFSKYFKPNKH